VDELGRRLAEWAADEAASERSRRRWLEQQAAEDVSWPAVLVDLAERRAHVSVALGSAAGVHGPVTAVGADFFVLDAALGATLVPFAAVTSLQPQPGVRVTGAPRPDTGAPPALTLATTLARLAGERPRVRLLLPGPSSVSGSLKAVGPDVIVVGLEDDARSTAYVPLSAAAAVVLQN
jgi:hypothetical protein